MTKDVSLSRAVLAVACVAAAYFLGAQTMRDFRNHEIAVLRQAADLQGDENARFWRDEAFNAYGNGGIK